MIQRKLSFKEMHVYSARGMTSARLSASISSFSKCSRIWRGQGSRARAEVAMGGTGQPCHFPCPQTQPCARPTPPGNSPSGPQVCPHPTLPGLSFPTWTFSISSWFCLVSVATCSCSEAKRSWADGLRCLESSASAPGRGHRVRPQGLWAGRLWGVE